jgi:hypothetical protein
MPRANASAKLYWPYMMAAFTALIALILCISYYIKYIKTKEGFSSSQYTLPRIIWSYWNDPNIPSKVKRILDEREEVLSGWDHRRLNEVTVYEYIPENTFPSKYDELSHQAKSDWIRLYLLKNYGGCWMDSTIIVNSSSEIERLYQESMYKQSELTGFYLSTHTLKSVNETYIESWFIMSPQQSPLISRWFEEFTEAVTMGFLPYKKKVFSKIDVSNIYGRNDENTYLTIHASLQYLLRHKLTKKPTIILVDAAETMFKPHIDCNWDSQCTVKYIKETPKHEQPSHVKLRGTETNNL